MESVRLLTNKKSLHPMLMVDVLHLLHEVPSVNFLSSSNRRVCFPPIAPVLSLVEQWLISEGESKIGREFPVRSAIMQICSNILLFAASGTLQQTLWKNELASQALARKLFS